MSDASKRIAEAFDAHPAFEPVSGTDTGGYRVNSTPFEGTVTATESNGAVEYRIVVRVPTLDAAVASETVAPVVEEGWFDTFELRLEDAHQATRDVDTVSRTVTREGDDVVVELGFSRPAFARVAVDDAKALVEYVEGTYVEGIIPGYVYGPPVDDLLSRAMQNYDE